MGNNHHYKLVEPIEATENIKNLIRFMFYPDKAPSKELEITEYRWFYTIGDNFKLKCRGINIEIKNNVLIKFEVKNATNICFNDDMKRYIEMIGLRGKISLKIEGDKIY